MSRRIPAVITYNELTNYTCSNVGLLLPLVNEFTWPVPARTALYFAAMLYCFLGIAIIADIFMCAILKIVSKTKTVSVQRSSGKEGEQDEQETTEVPVWNDTIANLTLLALGSAAPEILLSCIEIVGNRFEAGALGPGAVMGSAAFNLMCVTSLCVVVIPKGETRTLHSIQVFSVTSFFSVIAYIWLLIILKYSTPNVVDLWEAMVTFAAYPVLVILAYFVDKCSTHLANKSALKNKLDLTADAGSQPNADDETSKNVPIVDKDGNIDRDSLAQFISSIKRYPGITDEDAAILAAAKLVELQPKSQGWYRIGATRDITGGRKTQPQVPMKLKKVAASIMENDQRSQLSAVYSKVYETIHEDAKPDPSVLGKWLPPGMVEDEPPSAIVEFRAATCAVPEPVGEFKVAVRRYGNMDLWLQVRVESIDGTASANADYKPVNEIVTFRPGDKEVEVFIQIEGRSVPENVSS